MTTSKEKLQELLDSSTETYYLLDENILALRRDILDIETQIECLQTAKKELGTNIDSLKNLLKGIDIHN